VRSGPSIRSTAPVSGFGPAHSLIDEITELKDETDLRAAKAREGMFVDRGQLRVASEKLAVRRTIKPSR